MFVCLNSQNMFVAVGCASAGGAGEGKAGCKLLCGGKMFEEHVRQTCSTVDEQARH
mgnify:CR=1 FL=1